MSNYNLSGDAFTLAITTNIHRTTHLCKSFVGDWWVFEDDNPELTWEQLITLALQILHTEATRLFAHNLYIDKLPVYTVTPFPDEYKPLSSVRGAKRVNATRGVYQEWNHITQKHEQLHDTQDKFRLYGKDKSCSVEGTWLDWCCFACNILASENTRVMCPELYNPKLANANY